MVFNKDITARYRKHPEKNAKADFNKGILKNE